MEKDGQGKMQIVPIGWQPICSKEMPYELTVSFLLHPDKPGIPIPIKLQEQHKPMFPPGKLLDELCGQSISAWAKGTASQDAPGSTNAAGQPKPQPESIDEQAIIDSLKKSLSVMMKGFTAPQKKAFFDYVITGDVTVDKLQHFLDNYEKFKEMFTKLQAA